MAIDFFVSVPCTPQETIGRAELLRARRTRHLANGLRLPGDERMPSEIAITRVIARPEGNEEVRVTLEQLLLEAAVLDTASCAGCPAGYTRPYGCHGRITYPIPARAERWLMARLPTDLASPPARWLVRALRDFGWSGTPFARMRASGRTFFESRRPIGAQWSDAAGNVILSTDILMHAMFWVGNMQPTHARMLLWYLGVIPHATPFDALSVAGIDVPRHADPAIDQFCDFLRAMVLAVRLDRAVVIDT